MAMGAMNKYPGLDVKIVPVGLTYFAAHRYGTERNGTWTTTRRTRTRRRRKEEDKDKEKDKEKTQSMHHHVM